MLNDGSIFVCQKIRKRKESRFLLSNALTASVVYSLEVSRHFVTKNYA